jgi:hypothetical protein
MENMQIVNLGLMIRNVFVGTSAGPAPIPVSLNQGLMNIAQLLIVLFGVIGIFLLLKNRDRIITRLAYARKN